MVTKWYVPEVNSTAALALRKRFKPPSVLTHVHRIELQNAWQLKVYRKEMPAETAARAADDLQSDIDAGVWLLPEYDLDSVLPFPCVWRDRTPPPWGRAVSTSCTSLPRSRSASAIS